jgi:hypothetical protein
MTERNLATLWRTVADGAPVVGRVVRRFFMPMWTLLSHAYVDLTRTWYARGELRLEYTTLTDEANDSTVVNDDPVMSLVCPIKIVLRKNGTYLTHK